MAVSKVDPGAIDSGTVGFRLAPRINAAGRLRRADAGLELLLCSDPVRAKAIARELDELNADRRAVEQRIMWEAEAQVAELEAQRPRMAYVLAGADWHPGVVGIVASRIVERHHRPALLIALDEMAGTATGSGRSIAGFDLLGALHAVAGHLQRYGGHRAAAGVTLAAAELPALAEAFEAHAASALTPDQLVAVERVDAVVSGHELGLDLAEQLETLEPCGMSQPGAPAARAREPGSTTCARWGRAATPGSRCCRAGFAHGRWRSAATAGPWPGSTNRTTRRSNWSATPTTARSNPGWCCAMRTAARRRRSNG